MEREIEQSTLVDLGAVSAETKGPPQPASIDVLGNLGGAGLSDD